MNQPHDSRTVGRLPFTDGAERDVYQDADGRQWVAGDGGGRVYGTWLAPPDEPTVVSAPRTRALRGSFSAPRPRW
jgi:hypothetical protein